MAKVKYILLIPLNYNDGSKVPESVVAKIEDDLYTLAGGYFSAAKGKGAYRMRSGQKQVDKCAQYWVLIDKKDAPVLKRMVAGFASLLDQESIYLERMHSDVEFVEPSESDE